MLVAYDTAGFLSVVSMGGGNSTQKTEISHYSDGT